MNLNDVRIKTLLIGVARVLIYINNLMRGNNFLVSQVFLAVIGQLVPPVVRYVREGLHIGDRISDRKPLNAPRK